MKNGKGRHLTILHLYTGYKITEKSIEDMTALQYNSIIVITSEIMKVKRKAIPIV